MKKIKLLSAILVIIAFFCNSNVNAQTTWTGLNYNPDQENIEYNPLKGWISSYDLNQINFPSSTKHFYISLKDVYLGYGNYNWAVLDQKLNLNPGIMSIPRFYVDYPGDPYQMPTFLQSIVTSYPYDAFGNTTSRMPDYNDEDLIYALELFVAAYGARYNNDPRIACIDIGIYGFWGEWHVFPYNGYNDPKDYQMNQTNKDRLITAFTNAFPDTQVQVRMPNSTDNPTIKNKLGRYDDSFAYTTYGFWDDMVAAGLQDNYKTHPMGGEVHPNVKVDELLNSWPYYHPETNQNLEECIRRTHASWMGAHGIFTTTLNSTQYNNAIRASKLMGYTYYVRNVKLTPTTDKKVTIEVNIQNKGIAPFYYDWEVEFGAINTSNGNFTTLGTTSWNLPDIQATGVDYYKMATTNSLPDGNYKILMQIKNPLKALTSEAKPLRFANTTQDDDRNEWLTLGTATIGGSTSIDAFSQIEAENYSSMLGIQKETCSEGGQQIGFIENGDYIVFNNVNFGTGATRFDTRVSSATSGGSIEVRLDGISGTLVGTCAVTSTGGFDTWVTKTCAISGASGTHNLYLKFTGGTGYLFNMNWLKFTAGSTAVPVTSVSVSPTSLSLNVGQTSQLTATVLPTNATNKSVTWTSSNTSIATVSTSGLVTAVAAGNAIITVNTVDGNKTATCSSNVISTGAGVNIPALIQAENYNSQSGIQLETTTDTGGGQNVGWIETGDWLEYNVNVATSGNFTIGYRVASPNTGGAIQLKNASGTVLTTTTVPNTGGWQTWTTVTSSAVSLPAGSYALRLYASTGGFNFNWLEFKSISTNLIPNGIYTMKSKSNAFLTATASGAALNSRSTENGNYTKWVFTDLGSDVYEIKSVQFANQRMEVPNGTATQGSLVAITTYTGTGEHLKWKATKANGYFMFEPMHAIGMAIDAWASNPSVVHIYGKSTSNDNQWFTLINTSGVALKSASTNNINVDKDKSESNIVTVYPNPVSKTLYINHADAKGVTTIKIFNANGQMLYNKEVSGLITAVDVKEFKISGLILVQVSSGNDISTFKVSLVN